MSEIPCQRPVLEGTPSPWTDPDEVPGMSIFEAARFARRGCGMCPQLVRCHRLHEGTRWPATWTVSGWTVPSRPPNTVPDLGSILNQLVRDGDRRRLAEDRKVMSGIAG